MEEADVEHGTAEIMIYLGSTLESVFKDKHIRSREHPEGLN